MFLDQKHKEVIPEVEGLLDREGVGSATRSPHGPAREQCGVSGMLVKNIASECINKYL